MRRYRKHVYGYAPAKERVWPKIVLLVVVIVLSGLAA